MSDLEDTSVSERGLRSALLSIPTSTLERGAPVEPASHNDVVRLRAWGCLRGHTLSRAVGRGWFIGRSESCALQLDDPGVASVHAQLTYDGVQWWIRAVDAEHGLRQDGVRRDVFPLTAGVEIGLGKTVLIAESARSVALHAFCARLLGWQNDPALIDHALRAIRLAMTRRAALVLRGEGDLVPIAHALHRRMLAELSAVAGTHEPPFVVCDRRRRTVRGTVRAPANIDRGLAAFAEAAGGSLCVRSSRLPRDFWELLARLREPEPSVQLIVCLDRDDRGALLVGPMPIDVPPLRSRAREVPRIVEEYAGDAIAALRAPPECFTSEDLQWVVRHSASTLADIEKGTLRLVARKTSPTLGQAAARLGMAPVSLARWLERRPPRPTASWRAR